MSESFERISGNVPGERTGRLAPSLRERESRNVTLLAEDFPIFWQSGDGATVTDVDGNRFIDLTAAFGVANTGHSNPHVAAAVATQAATLMHGMGDVHPTAVRTRLLERLGDIVAPELRKTFLATTGSESIEAALKTAMIATGKARFAAYRNAYHGLSLGALPICGIEKFRAPFARALGPFSIELAYPDAASGTTTREAIAATRAALQNEPDLAAVVIEPVQGRGGCIVPPDGYLTALRTLCDELGALLIVDEIYTGFGRTGTWFAIDHEGVVPDLLCIGKAMGSGFPISAVIGKASVMNAWPVSHGEALHTSTYLGNPMGCAAAIATIDEMQRLSLPQRAAQLGDVLQPRLERLRSHRAVTGVRGRGLFWGVEFADARFAHDVVRHALRAGVIVLPSGPLGNVLGIVPPLVITEAQIERATSILEAAFTAAE